MRILIHLEGGIVQSISSDAPLNAEAVVVDYDTEGADAEDIHHIPQSDALGDTVDATIGWHDIDITAPSIAAYLAKERDARDVIAAFFGVSNEDAPITDEALQNTIRDIKTQIKRLAHQVYVSKLPYDNHDLARDLEVRYGQCEPCEAEQPFLDNECLMCGSPQLGK